MASYGGTSIRWRESSERWVHHAWHDAIGMHACFHEGWCTWESVEVALEQIKKLVNEVGTRMKTSLR